MSHRFPGRIVLLVATACGLLSVPVAAIARLGDELSHPRPSMTRFSAIEDAVSALHGEPLAVFLEDLEAQNWGMYYLRWYPVRFGKLIGYAAEPVVKPVMDKAPRWPWRRFRYLLTDAIDRGPLIEQEGWKRIWETPAFAIWDTSSQGWAIGTEVANPNGLDWSNGPLLWLGGGVTRVDLVASRAGVIKVAAEFLPGPSAMAAAQTRHLRLTGSGGTNELLTIDPGTHSLTLSVAEGENSWMLTPLDAAAVRRLPNGDVRPLLIGMRSPIVSWVQVAASGQ